MEERFFNNLFGFLFNLLKLLSDFGFAKDYINFERLQIIRRME